ncbi:MAG: 3-hydroxyacyl-ACP dehydratase FabZ [Firmicutes bacterium]|nr:3-hydroxyacyl-ACP dehydratase FabZ [Dethiobacter sp.]MBS3887697.1 3-hydroxyacyl-ACP dehydratase FabZ [Bacillota bacterium]MBS4053843.1 3-hydroxyacyl-ACP dehydratase FabZ [Thermaerobacter sp.]
MLNIDEIKKIIPHRYPFLLIDRISELEPGVRAVGHKNVTINEPFFAGHFPDYPIMPGVLVIEALAQVGAVALLSLPQYQGRLALFAGLDGVRFRAQVRPGDSLRLVVTLQAIKLGVGRGNAEAYVGDGKLAVSGQMLFALQ